MDIHKCISLKEQVDSVGFQINIRKSENDWILAYESFASEYDVNVGEAEEVGEVFSEINLVIKYCPYCGVKL